MLPQLGPSSRCDLHLHSNRSDGRFTPDQILDTAIDGELDIIALTDHDLSSNIPAGVHRRGDKSVFLINGAEMSGIHDGQEYHLLVYFSREAPQEFLQFCHQQVCERETRYSKAVQNLGFTDIASSSELRARGTESITRHHLAKSFVAAGHADTLNDAFRVFADQQCVPKMQMPFIECIRSARAAGGITSWAHPPLPAFKKHISTFAAAGLHGVEALRPGVGGTARKTYKKAAKRHGLVLTGGSDWHGWSDPSLGLFFVYQRDLKPFFDALWSRAA